MSEWIRLETRKPIKAGWYLTCDMTRNVVSVMGWMNKDGGWLEDGEYNFIPTHWMPLPEPPEEELGI